MEYLSGYTQDDGTIDVYVDDYVENYTSVNDLLTVFDIVEQHGNPAHYLLAERDNDE